MNIQAILLENLIGIVILLIVFSDSRWRRRSNKAQNTVLMLMVIASMSACVCDPLGFWFDGVEGTIPYYINYIANWWLYAMNIVIGLCWYHFLLAYLETNISKIYKVAFAAANIVGIVFLFVNFFYPIVFRVDEANVYSRGPLYFYFAGLQVFLMINSIIFNSRSKKESGGLVTLPMGSFLCPVLIGVILQTFIYGISAIWPFVAIGTCGLMFSLQSGLLFEDKLTGLHNRFYLDTIREKIEKSKDNKYTIFMMDLNDFKSINDRYGHNVGDSAIIEAAIRIEKVVAHHGIVIRFAGDEFVIVLNSQEDELIEQIINNIKEEFANFTDTGETRFRLSASIGYAKVDTSKFTFDEHINIADKLMYQDKKDYYFKNHLAYDVEKIISEEEKNRNHDSELIKKLEQDAITGAYNRDFFLEYVDEKLAENAGVAFDMISFKIESYALLQGRYGVSFVNKFTKNLVHSLMLKDKNDGNMLVGKIYDDTYSIFVKSVEKERHEKVIQEAFDNSAKESDQPYVSIKVGIYQNVDKTLSSFGILKRSLLPIEKIYHSLNEKFAFYDESIAHSEDRKSLLTKDAERAIVNRDFVVYYQPKMDASTGKIVGAEALVRWNHEEEGFLNPNEFISLFETNGFIYQLDKYVIDLVCEQLRTWIDEGKKVVPVSVNVSQADFDNYNLDKVLTSIVDSYNIPHNLIHFEITESVDAVDTAAKKRIVTKLKQNGFKIELDDFGVGYSTINSMIDLPIDVLKIDKSLLDDMNEEKRHAVLVSTLYAAYQVGLTVVCEGVETKEQVEELKLITDGEVDLQFQGYYYSKPIPKELFARFVMNHM